MVRDKIDWIVAASTAFAAIGAIGSAFAAWFSINGVSEQLELSRAQEREARRARIAVEEVFLRKPIVTGQPLSYRINYKNYGMEPAQDLRLVTVDGPWLATDLKQPKQFDDYTQNSCRRLNLYNDHRELPPITGTRIEQFPWTSRIDGVLNGSQIFVVDGCFSYKTRGSFHRTAFCYYYNIADTDEKNTFMPCPGGFSSD